MFTSYIKVLDDPFFQKPDLAILCIFDFSQKSEKFFEFIAKKREKCEKILKDIFTLNAFK